MNNNIHISDYPDLNKFASEQWQRSIAYLKKRFNLQEEECEDLFQEAFIILHNKLNQDEYRHEGSLSSYFLGICNNIALEYIRKKNKQFDLSNKNMIPLMDGVINYSKVSSLIYFDDDNDMKEKKDSIIHQIINDLPDLCNKILWKHCCENLPFDVIADMIGTKSAGALRVKKHRCCQKFRERYKRMLKELI